MFKLFLKSNLEDYKYLLILSPIINFVLFTILFIMFNLFNMLLIII